jgi:competence ComEA-like helix-hairpin-helix protein
METSPNSPNHSVGARHAVPSRPSATRFHSNELVILLVFFFGCGAALAQKKPPATPIDLNTATITQLEKLPGVGPTTAKAIIDFRSRSGPFQRVEDLLAIRGISKGRLEKLRPYVTVNPPSHKSN